VKIEYVLDTNIVARLLDNDPRVVPRVTLLHAETIGIPLVVLAELLFGVEKSAHRQQNRARVERFCAGVRVLPFDVQVVARYATVRAALEKKGRPKTDFDLVVACTGLEHNATLRSRDRSRPSRRHREAPWVTAGKRKDPGRLGHREGSAFLQNGRGGRIRTCDPQTPSLVR
jgi:tRNA(fMet)-specific endonuclease VapC